MISIEEQIKLKGCEIERVVTRAVPSLKSTHPQCLKIWVCRNLTDGKMEIWSSLK